MRAETAMSSSPSRSRCRGGRDVLCRGPVRRPAPDARMQLRRAAYTPMPGRTRGHRRDVSDDGWSVEYWQVPLMRRLGLRYIVSDQRRRHGNTISGYGFSRAAFGGRREVVPPGHHAEVGERSTAPRASMTAVSSSSTTSRRGPDGGGFDPGGKDGTSRGAPPRPGLLGRVVLRSRCSGGGIRADPDRRRGAPGPGLPRVGVDRGDVRARRDLPRPPLADGAGTEPCGPGARRAHPRPDAGRDPGGALGDSPRRRYVRRLWGRRVAIIGSAAPTSAAAAAGEGHGGCPARRSRVCRRSGNRRRRTTLPAENIVGFTSALVAASEFRRSPRSGAEVASNERVQVEYELVLTGGGAATTSGEARHARAGGADETFAPLEPLPGRDGPYRSSPSSTGSTSRLSRLPQSQRVDQHAGRRASDERPTRRSPGVDIVVTNHNYGRFVDEAVESALAQTHPRVKVVVVDDGSTDDSRELLRAGRTRVELVLKENGGQASALNAGFARCRGDITMLLDADDVLRPEAAERVARAFAADPSLAKVQFRMDVRRRCGASDRADQAERPPDGSRRATARGRARLSLRHPLDAGRRHGLPRRRRCGRSCRSPSADYPRSGADWYLVHLTALLGTAGSLDEVCVDYRVHGANAYEPAEAAPGPRPASARASATPRRPSARWRGSPTSSGWTGPTRSSRSPTSPTGSSRCRLEPRPPPASGDRVRGAGRRRFRAARRRIDVSAADAAAALRLARWPSRYRRGAGRRQPRRDDPLPGAPQASRQPRCSARWRTRRAAIAPGPDDADPAGKRPLPAVHRRRPSPDPAAGRAGWRERGHEVTVVTPWHGGLPRLEVEDDGVAVHRVRQLRTAIPALVRRRSASATSRRFPTR